MESQTGDFQSPVARLRKLSRFGPELAGLCKCVDSSCGGDG